MSQDRITFPTRRYGPIVSFFIRMWAHYETASLKVLGVVLVLAGLALLFGRAVGMVALWITLGVVVYSLVVFMIARAISWGQK